MFAQILIVSSAALVMIIGLLHLQGSFFLLDKDLEPSEGELKTQMKRVALNISPATDMWRAWIGFNAMFTLGLLLFGLVFGHLTLFSLSSTTSPVRPFFFGSVYSIWQALPCFPGSTCSISPHCVLHFA